MKQTSFLPSLSRFHGHASQKGKRKTARPFSHKNPIHIVLKSSRARGRWSLSTRENEHHVNERLKVCAKKYHIKIHNFQNVGNHLHLLIQSKTKTYKEAQEEFQSFLRRFAGEVAFIITNAKKGAAKGRFWDALAYSRIVTWGREFKVVTDYFTKNLFESKGLWTGSWEPLSTRDSSASKVGPP